MKRLIHCAMSLIVFTVMLTGTAFANEDYLVASQQAGNAPFKDTQGIWCEDSIQICYRTGLLEGVTKDTFSPQTMLTRAQITVITARLQDLLSGGSGTFEKAAEGEAWYEPAYKSLLAAAESHNVELPKSLINLPEESQNDPCPRWLFAESLAAALEISNTALPKINEISVLPDTYSPRVLFLYQAGIVNGTDAFGSFDGLSPLNRGQAAAMLARIISPSQRLTFTVQPFDLCRDLFQLDPQMVLLSRGDTDYTVLQFAQFIYGGIETVDMAALISVEDLFEVNLLPFSQTYIAPRVLAERCGLELSSEELKMIQKNAQAKSGYQGMPADFWVWYDSTNQIMDSLEQYYKDRYGEDVFGQPDNLWPDLGTVANECCDQLESKCDPFLIDMQGMVARFQTVPKGLIL